jgi:GDP-4-dehydro-6-deoxy-D-mannose reductase
VNGPVLITGASGFAGSHLLDLLAGRGELAAWSRAEPAAERRGSARWQRVDVRDPQQTRAAIRELRPSAVYHLAGMPHVAESFSDTAAPLASNVLGSHHLFDALRRARIRCRVVLAGSALIYRGSDRPIAEDAPIAPGSPYAVSKLAQEQLGLRALREDGVDVILTRPFNHTGPRQQPSFMAPSVARQIARIERGGGEPLLRVGNLDAVRDLTDVRDIVRAYEALMGTGTPGTIYNIASGQGRPVRQVLEALVSRSSVPIRVERDPSRFRANDTPVLIGDATRLREATGWAPRIPFDRMIDDLLAFWRADASTTLDHQSL